MFVELTEKETNLEVLLNKNQIIKVWKSNDGCGIDTIVHNTGMSLYVKESYAEIKQKINV